MSGYSRDHGGGDEYGGSGRNNYDSGSGQKRSYSDHNSRGGGYGSGGGSSGYSRGRSDNDDSGSGGHSRGRNDHYSNNDDSHGGGGGGYNRGRSDYRGGSSGGGGGGGGDDSLETQRDTIFIQNLPKGVSPSELKDVFSQIGIIKNDKKTGAPKIWIYKDKATGEGKGEATITYEDEAAAQAAINWYNGKEVLSQIVQISLATRRASAFGGGGRGGFRGRGGGGGGFRGRGGGGGGDGGYRGRGGDRGSDYRSGGGGEYRGGGRGASHGSSRDNRSNPY